MFVRESNNSKTISKILGENIENTKFRLQREYR